MSFTAFRYILPDLKILGFCRRAQSALLQDSPKIQSPNIIGKKKVGLKKVGLIFRRTKKKSAEKKVGRK